MNLKKIAVVAVILTAMLAVSIADNDHISQMALELNLGEEKNVSGLQILVSQDGNDWEEFNGNETVQYIKVLIETSDHNQSVVPEPEPTPEPPEPTPEPIVPEPTLEPTPVPMEPISDFHAEKEPFSVRVNWSEVIGAEHYNMYQEPRPTNPATRRPVLSPMETKECFYLFRHFEYSSNETIFYVCWVDEDGKESPPSEVITVKTPPSPPPYWKWW